MCLRSLPVREERIPCVAVRDFICPGRFSLSLESVAIAQNKPVLSADRRGQVILVEVVFTLLICFTWLSTSVSETSMLLRDAAAGCHTATPFDFDIRRCNV